LRFRPQRIVVTEHAALRHDARGDPDRSAIVVCRLRARALTPQPKLVRAKKTSPRIPVAAVRKKRQIYWPDLGKKRQTVVYDGERLVSGNSVTGPAIVETADTTVVVPPRAQLRLDELGNFELTF